jgi:uncharacterized protein YycO
MIHTYTINGLLVQTGDILCTTSAQRGNVLSDPFCVVGILVPGKIKHVAVYVGPDGWCVEAGPRGVVAFNLQGETWRPERMVRQRGRLLGALYGVAYPLKGRGYSSKDLVAIRSQVAHYCLDQARARKPYNPNYFNAQTDAAFYCSQLVYKAYLPHGIDLNTEKGVPDIKAIHSVVFPQEIWSSCVHQSVPQRRPAYA